MPVLSSKVILSDDEIFELMILDESLIDLVGKNVLISTGSKTYFLNASTRVAQVYSALWHGGNSEFAYLADDSNTAVYTIAGMYKTTLVGNWTVLGEYAETPDALFSITNEGAPGSLIYTRKNEFMEIIESEHGCTIIRDYDDGYVGTFSVLMHNKCFELNHHGRVTPFRFVGGTSVFNPYRRTFVDVVTQQETELQLPNGSCPSDAVQVGSQLLFADEEELYFSEHAFACDHPLKWCVIKTMCLNGYKDVDLLLSLTSRQLVTFYLDQA